jgi:hypothetical protein
MAKQLSGGTPNVPQSESPFIEALIHFGKRAAKKSARAALGELGGFLQTPEAKPIKDGLNMAHQASGGVLKVALHELDKALEIDSEDL